MSDIPVFQHKVTYFSNQIPGIEDLEVGDVRDYKIRSEMKVLSKKIASDGRVEVEFEAIRVQGEIQ